MDTREAETLVTVLDAAGKVGVTPLVWGDPGIGKSAAIETLAADRGVACYTLLGSQCEASDVGGIPIVPTGATEHVISPPVWARELRAAGQGVLFLDEFPDSEPDVQSAMLGVIFGKRVGNLRLPPGVQVIAAGNPPNRAANGHELTAPVANRLLHIYYNPQVEAWFDGMVSGFATPGITRALELDHDRRAAERAAVVAFVQTMPDLLHAFPAVDDHHADPHATGRAWPSRRTWQLCADVLSVIPDDAPTARDVAAAGLVGDGPAASYREWREHADLPLPADVIADPASVDWSRLDHSRAHAVLGGVVAYVQARGTQDAWRSAWAALAAAVADRAAVAAWAARRLEKCRPVNATPPKAARAFAEPLARMQAARDAEQAARDAAREAAAPAAPVAEETATGEAVA